MISNLALLFHALGKAALYTGIGPSILFVYAAEKLAKRFRVPAPLQGERWLECNPISKPLLTTRSRKCCAVSKARDSLAKTIQPAEPASPLLRWS